MKARIGAGSPHFNSRVARMISGISCRQVISDSDFDDVYRLRYDAYLNEQAIHPSQSRRLVDKFDLSSNGAVFGFYSNDDLIASLRIHVASKAFPDSPAMETFADYLERYVEDDVVIVDCNRFVIRADASRTCYALPYIVVRLGHMASAYFSAKIATATVRREHQAFYKRIFNFEQICEPRHYPTLTKPLSLMTLDFPAERDSIEARYPFVQSSAEEREARFGHWADRMRRMVEARWNPTFPVAISSDVAAHNRGQEALISQPMPDGPVTTANCLSQGLRAPAPSWSISPLGRVRPTGTGPKGVHMHVGSRQLMAVA